VAVVQVGGNFEEVVDELGFDSLLRGTGKVVGEGKVLVLH